MLGKPSMKKRMSGVTRAKRRLLGYTSPRQKINEIARQTLGERMPGVALVLHHLLGCTGSRGVMHRGWSRFKCLVVVTNDENWWSHREFIENEVVK